jgi:anti-anti-sigma factor
MEFEIKEMGHYHILVIDEKLDFYNVNEFKKIFFEVIDGRYSHVAVELKGNINEMSSSVLGALVTGQKKFTALKGKLAIINVGESVKNVMFVAGLSSFFTLVDDYDELMMK